MVRATCLVGLALVVFLGGQAFANDSCISAVSNVDVAKCGGDQVRRRTAELDQYYQAALAKLPDESDDPRKAKEQLVRAESAWKSFVDENCKYVGGLQGGSALYVSTFYDDCMLDELSRRIEFFRHLPVGG